VDTDHDALGTTFIHSGYAVVREVFARSIAERFLAELWAGAAFDPHQAQPGPRVIQLDLNHFVPLIYTQRLREAIDSLLGVDRWKPSGHCGFHPVVFGDSSGAPFTPPNGWHIDGNWFHPPLHETRQALVVLPLWTDIEPGGGGTAVCPGSCAVTARALHAAGAAGLSHQELDAAVIAQVDTSQAVELTGRAGDVVIMHAHLLHSGSPNHRSQPRVISNTFLDLLAKPDFDQPSSPYELVVHRGLVDSASAGVPP
jgi:hypothetical protein